MRGCDLEHRVLGGRQDSVNRWAWRGVIPSFQGQQDQNAREDTGARVHCLDWQMSHVRAEGQVGSEQGEAEGAVGAGAQDGTKWRVEAWKGHSSE